MVLGGALPPQVTGDNVITSQWCAQAKNKHGKAKKQKQPKKQKQKKAKTKKTKQPSSSAAVKPVASTSGSALAVSIPRGVANQVLQYQSIRVNFNPSLRIPNCVAYELTATMVDMADAPGHENRKNYNYARDPKVKECPENWEYRGSGYSRGHMAPAMDMRWDKTAMAQCFYMTNMCPQDTKLNNDHWRVLEEKVHRWAKRDKRILVFTGPISSRWCMPPGRGAPSPSSTPTSPAPAASASMPPQSPRWSAARASPSRAPSLSGNAKSPIGNNKGNDIAVGPSVILTALRAGILQKERKRMM